MDGCRREVGVCSGLNDKDPLARSLGGSVSRGLFLMMWLDDMVEMVSTMAIESYS